MADYKFTYENSDAWVTRYSDNAAIPNNVPNSTGNIDRKELQDYLLKGGIIDPFHNKQSAMDSKFIELDEFVLIKEKEPFYYLPKNANFFLDHDLATKAKVRSKDANTIWLSSDKDETGVKRKKIDFTKQELSDFADYIIDFGELILGVKFFHQEAIQDLFLNENKTYQDILDYNISTNWP